LDRELLTIDGLGFNYPGASVPALSEISCKIKAGECICLTGNSGCGKTTMLLAIMGLLRDGTLTGTLQFSLPPVDDRWSRTAGIVFQNAESQILCSTVAEEVAFGPENLCVPPHEIARRVREALRSVGLDGLEARNVERFSAGQKQRLTIASVLSMNPNLLLLDEPTSQLDVQGKLELFAILDDLKQQGYTLIMAEHDPRSFSGLIDRYLVLEKGHLVETCSTLPNPGQYLPKTLPPVAVRLEDAAPVIDVQGLNLCYPETGEVLKQLAVKINQ